MQIIKFKFALFSMLQMSQTFMVLDWRYLHEHLGFVEELRHCVATLETKIIDIASGGFARGYCM